ncbi:hypothetical protein SteCoe_28871 [Stentor coeruleus]|uniref:Uncharacterized protein n=1 Tax=Stentor coeruleus TaxID=5963 RepID=A0A1R2B7K9_9CILI|nr:hypothetical protein SteCoe_28871 [Stentor coeruleus]
MIYKEQQSIENLLKEDKNFCRATPKIAKHDISSWNSEGFPSINLNVFSPTRKPFRKLNSKMKISRASAETIVFQNSPLNKSITITEPYEEPNDKTDIKKLNERYSIKDFTPVDEIPTFEVRFANKLTKFHGRSRKKTESYRSKSLESNKANAEFTHFDISFPDNPKGQNRPSNSLSVYPQNYYEKFFFDPQSGKTVKAFKTDKNVGFNCTTPKIGERSVHVVNKKPHRQEHFLNFSAVTKKPSQSTLKTSIKELLSNFRLPKLQNRSPISGLVVYSSGIQNYAKPY